MTGPAATLRGGAVQILQAAEPADKTTLSHALAAAWRAGALPLGDGPMPPARPARPAKPELRQPRDMPKRRSGGATASRIALLHALAHIELNALDLAWDLIARFGRATLPRGFFDDWVRVADEEATHHGLVADRLAGFGAAYGDLPAHDGLWQAAEATAHDLLARLAVVPLVLEARGLDVTPHMIQSLEKAGDAASAEVLKIIYRDEVGHVAIGKRWFDTLCIEQGVMPESTYHRLVRTYFKGQLKPPFNAEARERAGLSASFYEPLATITPVAD
jgi:uncharacterized ferritin-like protein (DUF455 family)